MKLDSHHRSALLAGVVGALLAACASSAEMEARYAQSLEQWKGAPADRLVAAWGKPKLEETLPDGAKAFTYVVRYDMGNDQARMSTTTVVAPPAGGGFSSGGAGPGIRATTAGMQTSATVPITCTTRFVLQDGVVATWTFKGLGCGAPKQ